MTYIAEEVLLFAQNLVIYFQLDTQIGNVLVNDCLVGSKASETKGKRMNDKNISK